MEQRKNQSTIMQQHIAACKESGLTVEAYCNLHNLKPSAYYYWRKKLEPDQPGKFINIKPTLFNSGVNIFFTNGNRICFENLPPVDFLKQLMS